MENRIMIDLKAEDNKLESLIESGSVNYTFYNLLYYIKEKYDISVVDLSTIFDVSRQSIYNYFDLQTNDLPDSIKNKISIIYGEISLADVVNKELLVEYETVYLLPHLQDQISPEGHFYGSMGKLNINEMSEVYEAAYYDYDKLKGYIKIKSKYNFPLMWKNYIKEMKKPIREGKIDNRILNLVRELENTHSIEYLYLLLKVIQDRVEKDDADFFIYLTNYKGGIKEVKKVEIGSTVVMKVLETGELLTKTIKYQKVVGKPKSGTGAYYDLDYKIDVDPEKIENNVITNATLLGSALIGKAEGDIVEVNKNTYKIIEIK